MKSIAMSAQFRSAPERELPGCAPARNAHQFGALRARVAALETENAELTVEQTKLATERDILRQAAKYLAGETNWSAVSSSSLITGAPSR